VPAKGGSREKHFIWQGVEKGESETPMKEGKLKENLVRW